MEMCLESLKDILLKIAEKIKLENLFQLILSQCDPNPSCTVLSLVP